MKRDHSSISASPPAVAASAPLALWQQLVLSVLVSFHLLAVCVPPFAFATRSSTGSTSPAIEPVASVMRPYIDALYLDHAYFFFAPNPGPSHLVRYEIDLPNAPDVVGTFPDRTQHWPRLMYHRHFMIAEYLNSSYVPPNFPPKPEPRDDSRRALREYNRMLEEWQQNEQDWQQFVSRYNALRTSLMNHLQATHGGHEARVVRREHRQPTPDEFRYDNVRLSDDETYRDLPETPVAEQLPWIAPRNP